MPGKIDVEIQNYLALIHDLASGAEEWISKPSWLEFSPNNLCNLRCVMCEQADGVPLVAMKREEAAQLLDGVLPEISLWTPVALSEPLLGNFKLVVQKAREHEVWLNIYTNATLLTRERFLEMADRLYKLHISFDSHIPQVFEGLRVGAKFDVVVAHIKEVLPLAAERGIPVSFIVALMADNVGHVDDYVDFIADLGAARFGAEIRLQPMLYNAKGCENRNITDRYSTAEINGFLDAACARARDRKVSFASTLDDPFRRFVPGTPPPVPRTIMPDMLIKAIDTIQKRYPYFCSMASNYLKIDPEGTVFPCCRAPAELVMGNIKESPLEEIWNGEKYREFRRRMNTGEYPKTCSTCDVLVANPYFKAQRSSHIPPPQSQS